MAQISEAQEEAKELVNDLVKHMVEKGWPCENRGVNKTYAWAKVGHPHRGSIQAFYAVDEENTEDKFLWESVVITQQMIKEIVLAEDRVALQQFLVDVQKAGVLKPEAVTKLEIMLMDREAEASAAHSAAHTDPVPPTGAAHTSEQDSVPPIVPPTVDEAESAAHAKAAMPPTLADPLGELQDGLIADGLWKQDTPNLDKLAAEHDAEKERREAEWEGQEAIRHLKQAGQPANQLQTVEAVRTIARQSERCWSGVASPMGNDELLAYVLGKTITFRNRISGRKDEVTVCTAKEAKHHVPKITPFDFDAESHGEDLRILHFLQLGGSFRSVAVSQIVGIE